MACYNGNEFIQFDISDKYDYDWRNADNKVKRQLTPSEIDTFKKMCAKHNAMLVKLTIMPDFGWCFYIKANGPITPLSNDINDVFVPYVNR